MGIDKINNILESLKYNADSAESLHHLLYNSLLTFNGILITAFSIMVAIKPSLYSPFIIPYFVLSFTPVVGIVVLIYQMRQSFIDTTGQKTRELNEAFSELFNTVPDKPDDSKKPKTIKRYSRLLFVLDKVVIVMTLLNPIFIFIIIYNGGHS
ncbi:MAG: hypothetical protein NTX75_11535 [Proteobacteria bacterium]|nr:hypothetical protein [Pseudomonadota bacterium]